MMKPAPALALALAVGFCTAQAQESRQWILTTDAVAGTDLRLDSSVGPAAQVGLDGARLGTLEIDPYAVGMSIGRRLP